MTLNTSLPQPAEKSSILKVRILLALLFVSLIALVVITWPAAADDNQKPIAIYQEYNGAWYEFRYDWREYQDSPTDWQSLDELKAWLLYDDAPLILRAGADGVITFNGHCEDAAFQTRQRAYDVGKWLDTEILTRAECYRYVQYLGEGVYNLGINDSHYLNKAFIGNEVYFVNIQNDAVWKVYNLD